MDKTISLIESSKSSCSMDFLINTAESYLRKLTEVFVKQENMQINTYSHEKYNYSPFLFICQL